REASSRTTREEVLWSAKRTRGEPVYGIEALTNRLKKMQYGLRIETIQDGAGFEVRADHALHEVLVDAWTYADRGQGCLRSERYVRQALIVSHVLWLRHVLNQMNDVAKRTKHQAQFAVADACVRVGEPIEISGTCARVSKVIA